MSEYIFQDDITCWQRLKEDDANALGHLYDSYIDRLFTAAIKITDNRELAKDALQEIFVEIWHYRKSITNVNNSYGYLLKVLKSIILKKLKKQYTLSEFTEKHIGQQNDLNVEEAMVYADMENERRSRLTNALTYLTSRQKEVVKLRFYDGLTYEQIAEKLRMNYQSVNNLAFRAMVSLRKHI